MARDKNGIAVVLEKYIMSKKLFDICGTAFIL